MVTPAARIPAAPKKQTATMAYGCHGMATAHEAEIR